VIKGVIFDIGETIRDDTREFACWADWLDVPRHTFSAMIGALKALGGETNDVFEYFRPDFDLVVERAARKAAGDDECFLEQDLYPDARPALEALHARGLWIAIAGNQSANAAKLLRELNLPVDFLTTSEELGVSKPDPLFFQQVAAQAPWPLDDLLYVGDHRDHDVIAARRAGLRTALVRRGPWGYLWGSGDDVRQAADWIVSGLAELPELLRPNLGRRHFVTAERTRSCTTPSG
jgi:N-acetyl-D-muramate 6-phosphate phosphatase